MPATDTENNRDSAVLPFPVQSPDLLVREVNHRVANSLQIVAAHLAMASRELPDEGSRNVVRQAQNRVQAMAIAHRLLYEGSAHELDFADYLHRLCDAMAEICENGEEVNLLVQADPFDLPTRQALPLGMAVCELLMNAFKHALNRGGTVQVSCGLDRDGAVVLEVESNGGGGSPDAAGGGKAAGGLNLIQALLQQSGGTGTFVPQDAGYKFRATLPPSA